MKLSVLAMLSHLLLIILTTKPAKSNDQSVRFKSMQCISHNKSLVEFKYCRVKVARKSSWLSINITAHQDIGSPLRVKTDLSYRYGLIYREVVRVPEFEICGVLKNFNLMPPMMKAMFDIFGETMRCVLSGCPYKGDINLNMNPDMSKFPSILPSGFYKGVTKLKFGKLDLITFIIEVEAKSSILTSF